MATGSAKFLPQADLVIVLSANGTVEGRGSFQELCAAGNNATRFITSVDTGAKDETTPESATRKESTVAGKTRTAEASSKSADKRLDPSRQNGDFGIYKYYFRCISWTVVAIFLLLQFAYAFLCTFPSKYLDTPASDVMANKSSGLAQVVGGCQYASISLTVWLLHRSLHSTSTRSIGAFCCGYLVRRQAWEASSID
jgi:ATP-binding cassette subfamily C (CFTR/MRP) protein 1